jgi:hypothetical protein
MNILNMKNILAAFAAILLLNSCVKDDDYATPPFQSYICSDDWTSNRTINDVIAEVGENSLYTFPTEGEDQVFEGYVISSDETGNFYKTISLQDSRVNPTRGIQVELNKTNLFNDFPLGSKVRVKLNGLNGGLTRGVYKVGGTYNNGVGQLAEVLVDEHVKRACDDETELTPTVFSGLTSVLNNNKLNTLVTIEGVQFIENDLGKPYSVSTSTTNRTLTDAQGNEIILRTSSFADFASELLPEGSGKITGVLSKFDSTWQFYIRDTSDVVFDQPRFEVENGGGGGDNDQEAANFLFNGSDFENWTTFLGSLNQYGLSAGLAVHGIGTGRDGSNSFYLNGTTGTTNPYVFTVLASASTVPANPTKITMWVKGSAAKSLSFNLDTTSGRKYYNLGELTTSNKTLTPQENNQYTGGINTNNEWRLVTLDISGLTLASSGDLLALKNGSNTTYDVHIDNIKID